MRRILLPFLVLFAGCQTLHYRGTSPNVRSFSEDPNLNQYYIGFDFEFAVADPPADPSQSSSDQALVSPQLPEDEEFIPRPLPEPNIPW